MSKPNKNHHEWCKNYKARGQREINKAIEQERHKERLAKFAKRREEGKTYQYVKNPYDVKTEPIKHALEKERRARKVSSPLCEFQQWARYFGRMNRELNMIKEAERQEEIKSRKNRIKDKEKNKEDSE